MSEYHKIQNQVFGTRIGYHDMISGAFFHKFVKEYHEYDRRQKDVIAGLQEEIEQIREERDRYKYALTSMGEYIGSKKTKDPKDKIRRQKSAIAQLILQNVQLKEQLKKIQP